MEGHSQLRSQSAADAADWFARLQDSDREPTLREEFVLWLLRSPTHVDEFLAITRLWGDLDPTASEAYSVESLVAAARAESNSANVLLLDDFRGVGPDATNSAPVQPARLRGPRRLVPRVAASLAILTLGALGFVAFQQWSRPAHIRTAVGEQRTLTLADGSMVHLNTDSDLTVDLEAHERHLHLWSGEARFEVAKEKDRPFLVETPQATVRAVGTIFNVRAVDADTAVTVLEGRVEVVSHSQVPGTNEPQDSGPVASDKPRRSQLLAATRQLGAGERAAVTATGMILPDVGPPVESALAWSEQRLVFREKSLADVVAEFNRYQKRKLRIADPALAALAISGTFTTNDAESLLQYLERYHDVVLDEAPDGSRVLRLRRAGNASKP
jgi:transmembrane sensor